MISRKLEACATGKPDSYFSNGAYRLSLRGVEQIRYLPWSSYYRNFYTGEIEVRGPNT